MYIVTACWTYQKSASKEARTLGEARSMALEVLNNPSRDHSSDPLYSLSISNQSGVIIEKVFERNYPEYEQEWRKTAGITKLPRATKTQMVKFLREKGYDVPNSKKAEYSKYNTSCWLNWEDSTGVWHQATYSAAANRPYFMVDQKCIEITMADVNRHGMYREKIRKS